MSDHARNKSFFSASTLLMLTVAAYMSLSLIWHDPVPVSWRAPLTVAPVLFSLCITTMRVLVTRRPDLPFSFVRAGGYVSSAFLSLFWLVLVRDCLLGVFWLLSMAAPSLVKTREAFFSLLLSPPFELAMLAASFIMAAVGMALAARVPAVREVGVPVHKLPAELDGLRIVLLSDMHIGSCGDGAWLKAIVERSNALRPDFVLMAGDIADGSPERIEKDLLPLAELRARYGVITVPGNHDYYSGLVSWLEKWRSWGLTTLLNAHVDFFVRDCRIRVAGITDRCAKNFAEFRHTPHMGPPDIARALSTPQSDNAELSASSGESSSVPLPRADLTILLSHRPELAAESAARGADLQLSGHTHGGQFFFLFPLVSFINKGFRAGLYRVSGMPLYVSPGTGMWGYAPMRWGCRSEISLLTLSKAF